ncbi:winged helix-turn-helix domain-containing protein [Otoolea muris]|nr:helix-turn-helix domain-containing protein [Otoolea muris]
MEQEIKLAFIEFEILCLLTGNPGRVFSKEQIYTIVWNELYYSDYNIV